MKLTHSKTFSFVIQYGFRDVSKRHGYKFVYFFLFYQYIDNFIVQNKLYLKLPIIC